MNLPGVVFDFVVALFTDMPGTLENLSHAMGPWFYIVLFLIIFAETGLVVTPFLPGDSLLFAAGAVCALAQNSVTGTSNLDPVLLAGVLIVAALLGDTVNYSVGRWASKRFLAAGKIPFVKPQHLARTQDFFARHGGKTIILARFLPVIRTYAPFVAGAAGMRRTRYVGFGVIGAVTWITVFITLGFTFGQQPFVRANFKYVIVAIILISVLPAAYEFWRSRRQVGESAT